MVEGGALRCVKLSTRVNETASPDWWLAPDWSKSVNQTRAGRLPCGRADLERTRDASLWRLVAHDHRPFRAGPDRRRRVLID